MSVIDELKKLESKGLAALLDSPKRLTVIRGYLGKVRAGDVSLYPRLDRSAWVEIPVNMVQRVVPVTGDDHGAVHLFVDEDALVRVIAEESLAGFIARDQRATNSATHSRGSSGRCTSSMP